ncbi:MAG TPA: hypothetical protein VFB25_11205 [Gaiellaceae bacterium]|nr:hypothetical protein [Gaiellaceae bacterium]
MHKGPSRGRYLASIALAALVSGATVLLITGGIAFGSSAAEYQYGAPTASAAPTVSGTAQVGKTLTTTDGSWTSSTTISGYTYAWDRCDTSGNACTAIAGATSANYTLVAADQGSTIRSVVTATNSSGSASAQSAPTATVAPQTGGVIEASNVTLPDRMTINQVKFSQNPIRSRKTSTTMQIHVVDSNSNSVSGALVYVEGLPYSRIANIPETTTNATGWATVSLRPGRLFPRTGYVTMFVRARVQGQDPLAGSSTRRLVQVRIAAPNGT